MLLPRDPHARLHKNYFTERTRESEEGGHRGNARPDPEVPVLPSCGFLRYPHCPWRPETRGVMNE